MAPTTGSGVNIAVVLYIIASFLQIFKTLYVDKISLVPSELTPRITPSQLGSGCPEETRLSPDYVDRCLMERFGCLWHV